MIISEARNLAVKEILPTQVDGDRIGVHFDNGKVTVPESFHKAWKAVSDGEWLAMTEDPEWGGQGMPRLGGLGRRQLPHVGELRLHDVRGPHPWRRRARSRRSAPTSRRSSSSRSCSRASGPARCSSPSPRRAPTSARSRRPRSRTRDGTYSITGNKIFISGGEHDMAPNIIHPVLARIEGAPAGTAGISLFIVPEDLGQRRRQPRRAQRRRSAPGSKRRWAFTATPPPRSPSAARASAAGLLLGEANKGMRAMFLHDERRPADGGRPGPVLRERLVPVLASTTRARASRVAT